MNNNIQENYFITKPKDEVINELQEKIKILEGVISILQDENTELKQKLDEKMKNDIIKQYHLLRQGKTFPFSSILSKNHLI